MKNLVTLFTLLFIAILQSYGQTVFTRVLEYDKFDDVISDRTVKTLVTKSENYYTIETKGEDPIEYFYVTGLEQRTGSRDSIANLVDNVFGYETKCYVFTKEYFMNLLDEETSKYGEDIDNDSLKYRVGTILAERTASGQIPVMTRRVVSEIPHTFIYKSELLWIKFPDGSRTIYIKE